jgi:hypothetical protein
MVLDHAAWGKASDRPAAVVAESMVGIAGCMVELMGPMHAYGEIGLPSAVMRHTKVP